MMSLESAFTTREPAIRIRGLSKFYGKKAALAEIDLDIADGERFCLVGLNGSGKSTLLELIMGIRQSSTGDIRVLGCRPTDPSLKHRRAIMISRPSYFYFAKVKEIIWLYSGFYGRHVVPESQLLDFALDGNSYVRHLSTGQLRRLALLLTLLGDPQLVLLDEPASGLDPQARMKLWQVLGQRLSGGDRTLVFSTHDLAEAERWADRVGVLYRGRLIAVDSVAELCRASIGTTRKVTIADGGRDPSQFVNGHLRSFTRFGSELALYTDRPEDVLRALRIDSASSEYRVERVSLRDVFFRLTGEVPDASQLAGLGRVF